MATQSEGISGRDIQSGLAELREEGLLCDIELEAQGRRISAHRALLASVSHYFRVLFAGGFREANESLVVLQGIEFESLKTIVDSLYTPELKLTNDNVCGVLTAAHMFQIDKLLAPCEQFMREILSKETCLSFLRLAETYNIKKLISKANDCILENFLELRETPDFKKISKDALVSYLSHNKLYNGYDESLVFYTAKDWLEYDPERMQYATEIMSKVRFNSINLSMLTEISDIPLLSNNKECQAPVKKAFAYHGKQFQKPLHETDSQPRGEEGILVVQNMDDHQDLEQWKNISGTVVHFTSLHHRHRSETFTSPATFVNFSLSAVQRNNFLFIFGVDNDSFEQIAFRFDGTTNEWLPLAPVPQQATVKSCVARLHNYIYFFGGQFVEMDSDIGDDLPLSTKAFVYEILSNHWRKMPDIAPVFSDGAATSCPVNNMIYVSGGYSQDDYVLTKFTTFDTRTKLWLDKPPLNHARGAHVMETVALAHIFVIGGIGVHDEPVQHIELFDLMTEQWSDINRQTSPIYDSFALVKEYKVYLVGGGDEDNESNERRIKIYDTLHKDYYKHRVKLPFPASGHVCGLLTMQVRSEIREHEPE